MIYECVKQLLLFILFCISFSSIAQETIELKGKIINQFQTIDGVTVINIRTDWATVSNELGVFKMRVSIGDTLEIGAVHFETEKVVISSKIYEAGTYEIYLIPNVTELDEVQLSNSFMKGMLYQDATSFALDPSKIDYNPDSSKPISAEKRRLYSATSKHRPLGGSYTKPTLAVSLDGLLNAFSGKTKRLRKHVAISEYALKIKELRSYYADTMFTESLKMPIDRIDDFLMYLFKDATHLNRIAHYNKLEILNHLEKRSPDYLVLLNEEVNMVGEG